MTAPRTETILPPPRLVVFAGARGGCGTTLLASHVAAMVAAEATVCLADFDFCKGGVAGALDLDTRAHLAALLEAEGALDLETVKRCCVRHPTGVDVLVQPHDLGALRQVGRDAVRKLIGVVRSDYDLMVVDAGSRVDVPALTAMLAADVIVLNTTNSVAALRDAQRVQALLGALEVPSDRIRIVVNRFDPKAVSIPEVEELLARPVTLCVPYDARTCRALDLAGTVAAAPDDHRRYATTVRKLWPALRGLPTVEPVATGGWFASLLRRAS